MKFFKIYNEREKIEVESRSKISTRDTLDISLIYYRVIVIVRIIDVWTNLPENL